jgi:hypothetical protein
MFPRHLDSGSHIVSQDDELRRTAVIMGAKADDVDLSHNGPQNSEKSVDDRRFVADRTRGFQDTVSLLRFLPLDPQTVSLCQVRVKINVDRKRLTPSKILLRLHLGEVSDSPYEQLQRQS